MNEGPTATRLGLRGIPGAAESTMVRRDVELAALSAGRLHLAHLSCLESLEALRDALTQAKNAYWAQQSEIQRRAVAAWIALADTKTEEAVTLMRSSADLEDSTEKHPVTPGSIKPARELLGEMLLQAAQPGQALKEFEASQRTDPDRFNGIYGAARAAELAGDREKARAYYGKLVSLAAQADTERPELKQAKAFLGK